MSESGNSATTPTSPLFGSCHIGRSPFHWNRAQNQADLPTEVPWRLPWRASMDEGRPSSGSSGGVRRRLSRAAQSLPPTDTIAAVRGHEVFRRGGEHPRFEGFATAPATFAPEGPGYAGGVGQRAASSLGSAHSDVPRGPVHLPISHGAAGDGKARGRSRQGSLSQALSPFTRTSRGSTLSTASSDVAAPALKQPLLSSCPSGTTSPQSRASTDSPYVTSADLNGADVEAALPPDHYSLFPNQRAASYDRSSNWAALSAASEAAKTADVSSRVLLDGVTGLINTIVSLPVMLSFAVIIFNDSFFARYSGSLVRLVLLSAAIHQAVFTALSTIPFAVGQVQDVGLIFCSSIASSVVAHCKADGLADNQTLATVLLTLTLSTLSVGIAIVIIGKLRLASMVQYMPLSVIGGYLGYVGFFVAVSGASLATGRSFDGLSSLLHLASPEVLQKLAPAVAGAAVLWAVTHRIRSAWALPTALVVMPALFFAVLYGYGSDIEAARSHAWFQPRAEAVPGNFWDVWRLFRMSKVFAGADGGGVLWSAMPRQALTVAALAFVVAFGSSLDVAAIQQDNSEELDYNRELVTVGISNIAAGLSGAGYTGSYIFSQTIFSMRANVKSRACGAVVVIAELACFAAPFSIVEFLPLFFFGALMLWIGYEILQDWLVGSYQRMTALEYLLLWLTFLAITGLGLEGGIAVGVVLAALFFSFQYARINVTAFSVVPSRSGFVRSFQQRATLESFTDRVIAVSLSGYVFFGSAVKIGENVCQIVRQRMPTEDSGSTDLPARHLDGVVTDNAEVLEQHHRDHVGQGRQEMKVGEREVHAVVSNSPRFCLLDLRRVSGIDGTASRQFCMLRRRLERLGIELVITHVPAARPEVLQLLLANGVVASPGCQPSPGMCRAFPTLDQGLFYCEEVLLNCAVQGGLCQEAAAAVSLAEVLRTHLEHPTPLLPGCQLSYDQAASDMAKFMTPCHLEADQVLFRVGDQPDALFIIHSGTIMCRMQPLHHSPPVAASSPPSAIVPLPAGNRDSSRVCHDRSQAGIDEAHQHHSLFQYGPGAMIGELDFFVRRPRSFLAHAHTAVHLLLLPRSQFERMAREAPDLTTLLQAAMLRCTCLSAAHALEALETDSAT